MARYTRETSFACLIFITITFYNDSSQLSRTKAIFYWKSIKEMSLFKLQNFNRYHNTKTYGEVET